FHDRGRIQRRYFVYSSYGWLRRAITGIDKNSVDSYLPHLAVVEVHFQGLRTGKAGLSHQQVDSWGTLDSPLAAVAKAVDNLTFALSYFDHINGYGARLYTVVSASSG